MQPSESQPRRKPPGGFTLPAILVVVGALLILAVGVILIVNIERNTSRSFVDRERAELAARAGLEYVKGIFGQEAANDDFLIVQGSEALPDSKKDPIPYLYLARGSKGGTDVSYRYLPLFSTAAPPAAPVSGSVLGAPKAEDLVGSNPKEISTLPWYDPARIAWIEVPDEKGRIVSRYAYWVEDLQGKLDAGTVGNTEDGGAHKRFGWKEGDNSDFARFPAPGLNPEVSKPGEKGRDEHPPLNQVALYALDPEAGASDQSPMDKKLIDGRKALVSPDSVLGAYGVEPPLTRAEDGHLEDETARALEESLAASVQPYDEQPLVPFAYGIDPDIAGKPKLNLNALIEKPGESAVDEMAAWIDKGLPDFVTRKGGFKQDYLKTLAASAIAYAAPDNKPLVQMGNYRGLGASPMISEVVLDINYLGYITRNGSKVMLYQFILFAELLNHTNLPISGSSAMSFEVGLTLPAIGAIPAGTRFDELLGDPTQSTHDLVNDGRYFSKPVSVSMAPGEYRFYKFASVNFLINIGGSSIGSQFTLSEQLGAAGLSMKWNGTEVERIPAIVRDSQGLTFSSGLKRYFGKAAIPGHSYGPYGEFINNMGDPRIAHFIPFKGGSSNSTNGIPLGGNAFPENVSPNRRNIRFGTIYSGSGDPAKLRTYGRVIPSEWPDGGHDAEVTGWAVGWSNSRQGSASTNGTGPAFDPTTIPGAGLPEEGESLTYLSDRKRYYSATELGRIYDPIMFLPTFDPSSGLSSVSLRAGGEPSNTSGIMPAGGVQWPGVQVGNTPSIYFGGGNTLRIGRPEHPRFDQPTTHEPREMPSTHAARLLDLFHAGKSRSDDQALREGPVVRIEGHVNINTASRDALRSLAAGFLTMDPKLSKRTSDNFDGRMAPAIQALTTLSAPTVTREADKIADSIIAGRPFATPSELACVTDIDGKRVFGNPEFYPEKNKIQWTDSAAEEVFGRVYEASTVRSRNFRVWVVGQALAPTFANNPKREVLAETRRAFTVFSDPGERKSDGAIDPNKFRVKILHENDF